MTVFELGWQRVSQDLPDPVRRRMAREAGACWSRLRRPPTLEVWERMLRDRAAALLEREGR